uniref:glutaminyl-peptide cyclotransferase n=1 Tax=Hucho hucho TaxID=62062 RepID=A0A4W5NZA2_9TELE
LLSTTHPFLCFSSYPIRPNGTRLWETHLRPILIERLPGTLGSQAVRQHISSTLSSLSTGWTVELDSFLSPTPRGQVTFSNIIATLDPGAPRRLLLTCHYDSKVLPLDPRVPESVFLGASDSAVPCAMILELASTLDTQLKGLNQQVPFPVLSINLFPGTEFYIYLSTLSTDQGTWQRAWHTPHPLGSTHTNLLQATINYIPFLRKGERVCSYTDRQTHYHKTTSPRLMEFCLMKYFQSSIYFFFHTNSGVHVLHVIATPFPLFWYTLDDTEENMHRPTVENLTKVLAVFLAEYLGF